MSASFGTFVKRSRPNARTIAVSAATVVLIAAMALSTKVVKIDSAASAVPGVFSVATYGIAEFPKVRASVERRAVDAAALAAAITKDRAAAEKRYGVASSEGAEMPVKFVGTVGKGDFGTYDVRIDGVPKRVAVKLQTGPAILGTDLRDATGEIAFGQFTNQIDYQNAGSALNKQLKKDVLSKIDTSNLTGKRISVVGVFASTDPANWLVTPVSLDVR